MPFATLPLRASGNRHSVVQPYSQGRLLERINLTTSGTGADVDYHTTLLRRRASYSSADAMYGCPQVDFSADVSIGGQTFGLLLDTGSTTLAVASSSCALADDGSGARRPCGVTRWYDPAASSTETYLGYSASGHYGDGSQWSGTVYRDNVQIGALQPVSMRFVAITSQTSFFSPFDCRTQGQDSGARSSNQGILGLAYQSLALSNTDGWWPLYAVAHVSGANPIADVFAMEMCLYTGTLWLGGYPSFTPSQIKWASIIRQQYFNVQLTGSKVGLVGQASFSATSGIDCVSDDCIVDSGTTLTTVPSALFHQIAPIVAGLANSYAYGAVYDSTDYSTGYCWRSQYSTSQLNNVLPKMTITLQGSGVGSITLTLNAISSYFLQTPVQQNDGSYVIFYCPGLSPGSSGDNGVIMGWTAMNQYVTIFDRANSRVGFVTSNSSGCANENAISSNTGGSASVAADRIVVIAVVAGVVVGIAVICGVAKTLMKRGYWGGQRQNGGVTVVLSSAVPQQAGAVLPYPGAGGVAGQYPGYPGGGHPGMMMPPAGQQQQGQMMMQMYGGGGATVATQGSASMQSPGGGAGAGYYYPQPGYYQPQFQPQQYPGYAPQQAQQQFAYYQSGPPAAVPFGQQAQPQQQRASYPPQAGPQL